MSLLVEKQLSSSGPPLPCSSRLHINLVPYQGHLLHYLATSYICCAYSVEEHKIPSKYSEVNLCPLLIIICRQWQEWSSPLHCCLFPFMMVQFRGRDQHITFEQFGQIVTTFRASYSCRWCKCDLKSWFVVPCRILHQYTVHTNQQHWTLLMWMFAKSCFHDFNPEQVASDNIGIFCYRCVWNWRIHCGKHLAMSKT